MPVPQINDEIIDKKNVLMRKNFVLDVEQILMSDEVSTKFQLDLHLK